MPANRMDTGKPEKSYGEDVIQRTGGLRKSTPYTGIALECTPFKIVMGLLIN